MCPRGSGLDARGMNVIEVTDLTKRYGDRAAVDRVSFSVEEGEIFGILGPNGAGKTTTVESIAGLRTPDAGTIRVLGLDPRTDRDRAAPARGRPAPGERAARPDDRPGGPRPVRVVLRAAGGSGRSCIADLGLEDKRDTAYRNLSGGQKQRLSIALALIGQPRIAILDELSTGLDPQARRETWQLIESIRDRGVTVLLVTHLMEEAERLADRIAVIAEGRVIALDTPAGIVSMVDAEQRLRFRPSAPIDDTLLTGLPEVRRVERSGPSVVVTGTGNLLQAVTSVLARHQIVANDLRIDQANLDDAYLALTEPPDRGPHRQGAVMNEMRALLVAETKLLFRDPITLACGHRPADGHPAHLRLDVRAAGAGSRRSAACASSTCSCRRWS